MPQPLNEVPEPFPAQSLNGPWLATTPLVRPASSIPPATDPPARVAETSARADATGEAGPRETARITMPAVAPRLPLPEDRIYNGADADVTPPAFLRRQVPSLPEDTGTGPLALLLLVDVTGQVLQVRTDPPGAKLRDGLLLPAAKAWQFQPAVKDGRPVRYWLRVPVAR